MDAHANHCLWISALREEYERMQGEPSPDAGIEIESADFISGDPFAAAVAAEGVSMPAGLDFEEPVYRSVSVAHEATICSATGSEEADEMPVYRSLSMGAALGGGGASTRQSEGGVVAGAAPRRIARAASDSEVHWLATNPPLLRRQVAFGASAVGSH